MRACERCGRMHCAQCNPPETHCEAGIRPKKKEEEETLQTRASLQDKKEDGKTSEDRADNEGPQLESDNPAVLDKLLRQLQERGPAPATMEWIPRTVRPRFTTIQTRISVSAQAAELAEGSGWDGIRWRTSVLLYIDKSKSKATKKTKPKKATK